MVVTGGCVFPAGILYVLVYRTDDYKRLKAIVDKQSKKRKEGLTEQAS